MAPTSTRPVVGEAQKIQLHQQTIFKWKYFIDMDGMGTTVIISWEMSRFQIILDVTFKLKVSARRIYCAKKVEVNANKRNDNSNRTTYNRSKINKSMGRGIDSRSPLDFSLIPRFFSHCLAGHVFM